MENEKQDPFQFASAWLWCSRCFINPYVFKWARKVVFFHSKFLQANFRRKKGAILWWAPGST